VIKGFKNMKTDKKMWVVMGYNGLLNASGAVAIAETKEAAERAAKDTEWICDSQKIEEISVYN
jgi:hypothetical protein